MVTFRSPIWDSLLEFLDRLKDYPSFETMNDGKYKKRIQFIIDRALERMRLDKTDFDLISQTFVFLNERDLPSDFVEYMNENKNLGYKCATTRDGEKIIRECEAIVKQRRADEELKARRAEAQAKFAAAEAKKAAYEAEQNKIADDWETAKNELDEIENACKDLPEKPETVETVKEEVKANE